MSDKAKTATWPAWIAAAAALIGSAFGPYVHDFAALRQAKVDEFERVASVRGSAYADVSEVVSQLVGIARRFVDGASAARQVSYPELDAAVDRASDAIARLQVVSGPYVLPALSKLDRCVRDARGDFRSTDRVVIVEAIGKLETALSGFVAMARRDVRSFLDKS